ncbi:aminoglycoside phosphotransferase family protein [Arthrobacter globiformis]|uniref:aminoglycoside phosphotransferase family protein n=1 Tax=Arthrobacter globiformis TaxID=1665 RepID=UPI0039787035
MLLTPQFVTSRHVVALVFARDARQPVLVVKIPRRPGDNGGVRREADVLRQLRSAGGGGMPGIPEVVGLLDVGPHCVLVETALAGAQLDPRQVAGDLAGAVEAGTSFLSQLPRTLPADSNKEWYERKIRRPLHGLSRMLPGDGEVGSLVERTHKVLAPLRSVQLPAVVEHGDLSHPNLFLPDSGQLQVVDWERASSDGVPGHDLVFYLQYLSESFEHAFTRSNQLKAFDKAFGPAGWGREPLREHLQMRGVDQDLIPLLIIATWARSAATLADRLLVQEDQSAGQVRAAVFSDRDFWLWRHVVDAPWQRPG